MGCQSDYVCSPSQYIFIGVTWIRNLDENTRCDSDNPYSSNGYRKSHTSIKFQNALWNWTVHIKITCLRLQSQSDKIKIQKKSDVLQCLTEELLQPQFSQHLQALQLFALYISCLFLSYGGREEDKRRLLFLTEDGPPLFLPGSSMCY